MQLVRNSGRPGERGEGRIGAILSLIILVVLIYLGIKYVPVLIQTYTFRDHLEEEARYAALRKGNEEILNRILAKARQLELPVEKSQIRIRRGGGEVTISVKYTVPIETPVFTHNWRFEEKASAPIF